MKTASYSIETEIPSSYSGKLADYIWQKYVLNPDNRFKDASRAMLDGTPAIMFTVTDAGGKRILGVEVKATRPLSIKITALDEGVTEQQIDDERQDLVLLVQLYEDRIRTNTLYFAWREGEKTVPEKIADVAKKPVNRFFLQTQILLFIAFIFVGMIVLLIVGNFLVFFILMLGSQLILVLYSNKFVAKTADWRITKDDPYIHMLEYHLPFGETEDLQKKMSKNEFAQFREELFNQVVKEKGEMDCQAAGPVFSKYGIQCNLDSIAAKKVNVYDLVKKTADRFKFPMPEIVVANTMIPNAAASGPSPRRGIVLITTGLLISLDENEILSVLGHEFGHLKGRDPLVLFGLNSLQYLFTFYVAFGLFPWIFSSILFFLYFWAVLTVTYFIAKFFEARADLTSAIVVGQPEVLAESLEKIGFKRLLYERAPQYRFQEWISLDPHPPLYFRISQLRRLKVPVHIGHPLLTSAKEVTKGFFAILGIK